MNARAHDHWQGAVNPGGGVLGGEAQSSKRKAQGKVQGASTKAESMDSGFCQRANSHAWLNKTSHGPAPYGAWNLNLPLSFELYPWSFFRLRTATPSTDNPLFPWADYAS